MYRNLVKKFALVVLSVHFVGYTVVFGFTETLFVFGVAIMAAIAILYGVYLVSRRSRRKDV